MVSEADIDGAKKSVLRFSLEWRKRKRACMDIIDQICESADFNRKDFIVSAIRCESLRIEEAGHRD